MESGSLDLVLGALLQLVPARLFGATNAFTPLTPGPCEPIKATAPFFGYPSPINRHPPIVMANVAGMRQLGGSVVYIETRNAQLHGRADVALSANLTQPDAPTATTASFRTTPRHKFTA
ncbi:hypothetical protein CCM_04381 [Cordyceps militaris CM01]|uniref:Uncharacterized protein n=1 Tax=Cordyceps militaris (strain CM01) TaxID=983644 RepID=G3JEQ0_CORMM|nr:uncharacterized protein CCM_04381 [Cordyceps militaris CM01]EGX93009.1 hypothetical protein CCM_04381 [Cordyceps militaris CM01]